MKKKKIKKLSLEEQIKQIYEQYPEKDLKIKDWNKGGFVDDDKYRQPIKHKLYKR